MSIEVAPDALAETLDGFGPAYLLTLGGGRRPHVVAVEVRADGPVLRVAEPGRTSGRNIGADAAVTLLLPPLEPGGHSLIVDGWAELGERQAIVTPQRAVLHRPPAGPPATPAADGGCVADCVEIPVPAGEGS